MNRRNFVKSNLAVASIMSLESLFPMAYQTENLPNVLLLGDSIRIGYRSFVEKELQGIAKVWAPDENCRTTDNIIYNLQGWIKNQDPDLVHINVGLHDIRTLTYDSKPGETIVKPLHYHENLETIFRWIQQNVGCRIIWATTTPVLDDRIKAHNKSFIRYNVDVQKINKIAMKVCRKNDVPVNDLYAFVKQKIGEDGIKEDGVHYSEGAYRKLGTHVAGIIRNYLERNVY
jgi:lysophospholipase L1-like esterase